MAFRSFYRLRPPPPPHLPPPPPRPPPPPPPRPPPPPPPRPPPPPPRANTGAAGKANDTDNNRAMKRPIRDFMIMTKIPFSYGHLVCSSPCVSRRQFHSTRTDPTSSPPSGLHLRYLLGPGGANQGSRATADASPVCAGR